MAEHEIPWESLTQAAPVGLKVMHIPDADDPETWRYVACNESAASGLGMTVDQVVGKRLLDVFPAVRGTAVIDNYRRCISDRVTVPFGETSYTHADGRQDWYRAHVVPLDDQHVGAVFQNITAEHVGRQELERSKSELESRVLERTREVRLAQRRVQAIVDNAADLILEIDEQGAIAGGSRLSSVTARTLTELAGAENGPAVNAAIREALETRRSQITVQQTVNGHQILSISLAPIDADATPRRLVAIVRDITHLEELQRERHLRERMATLGTLAAGIGHEINNPLQYMTLNVELLRRKLDPDDKDSREALDELQFGARRIREVVEELRRFVQGNDGGAGREVVDPRSVVDRTIALANYRIRERARLERDYSDVPAIRVAVSDLSQAVLNLLVNAADALEGNADGVIRVRVRHANGDVEIGVSDNGPGIGGADRDHVFDAFWSSKGGGGMGLGLSISRDLIARNGGTLTVDSEPGSGTTFWIRLPAQVQDGDPTPTRPALLVIDDEVPLCNALAKTLTDFDVTTRTDLEGAREALANRSFDIVLCDLFLGPERGDELWRELRGSNPDLAERFVFMTGTAVVDLTPPHPPLLYKPIEARRLTESLAVFLADRRAAERKLG